MSEINDPAILSLTPTQAWALIKKHQKIIKLNVTPPSTPVEQNMLRFVCMSDTHSLTSHLRVDVPDGDVFLHAGDFTRCGMEREIKDFNEWVGNLPHKYKIVIAGNHELSFDPKFTSIRHKSSRSPNTENLIDTIPTMSSEREELKDSVTQDNPSKFLTNATYLEDELISISGIKIYGTPWQPEFLNWAFNLPRGKEILEKWSKIPEGIDILLSHTPPLGHGDLCSTGVRAGCVDLLSVVQERVKPKYHVFGHIHEGYGVTTDGKIIYVNASTCDVHYTPCNKPVVFDIPIPEGFQK